jgi:hypothetical protein
MSRKIILTLAVSITAFILVVSGAVIGRAALSAQAANSTSSGDIQALLMQREAEYQARLEEANAALSAVYTQQGTAAQENGTTQTGENAASLVKLSPEDALLVAVITAPNARILRVPELVNFQGTVAYEVTLDTGVLYIDANTGLLLYDSTAQVQLLTQSQSYHDDDGRGEYEDD